MEMDTKQKHVLEKYPKCQPEYPTALVPWGPGVGSLGIVPNYFENMSVSIGIFFKIADRQVFQSFRIG